MNRRRLTLQYSTIVFGAAALFKIGACTSSYDDHVVPLLDPDSVADGGGGTGGTTTSTLPAECIPGNTSSPVDASCGVFVSSSLGSDDDADPDRGSPTKPYATIAEALAAAEARPLYLCAETFTETLALTDDATFYGGLDCANGWAHVGATTKTTWTANADATPLHVVTGARATVQDVALVAADASAAGSSSIAVIAEAGTQLELSRCDVRAGEGASGADGDAAVDTGTAGVSGNNGSGSCTSDVGEFGGSGGQLTCDPTNVAGGQGGTGNTIMTGGAGSPGIPVASTGIAGLGQGVNVDCATDGNGAQGATGTTGDPGLGASASPGTLSPTGYAGASGSEGQPGKPGQGGGGGGGGKGCANGKAGPSGGGGGSGGCGGSGGKGGQAGGPSIGIVSLGAKLTLDDVTITTKAGGKGGGGAMGQPGGPGGPGGMPGAAEVGGSLATACSGGPGGTGGPGGRGGGGKGGPSIGIAHTGDPPDMASASITTGTPGNGGDGEGDGGAGAPGVTGKVVVFN